MQLNFASLFGGFVFGVLGFYLWREARKRTHVPWLFLSVALMLYPYFVASALQTWLIGLGLCAVVYFLR